MKNKLSILLIAFLCVALSVASTLGQDAKKTEKRSISATATDRIAPFISNDVFLVVRIDFDAFDAEQIANMIDSIFVAHLKERGFESKRTLQTNREFKRGLDVLREQIDAVLAFRQALAIRELFLIVQNQSDDSVRFFIPLGSSKKDLVRAAFSETLPGLKIVDLPGGLGMVTDAKADKAIYSKFEPRPNPRLKKFFEESAGSTIQIYSSALSVRALLDKMEKSDGEGFKRAMEWLPSETAQALSSFDSYFQELRVVVDLNKLTIDVNLAFTTAERAEDFRKGLEKVVNAFVDDFFKDNADVFYPELSREDLEKYNLVNLTREIARASALRMIPDRNGATLSLRFTPESKDALRNSCLLQVPFIPALISQLSKI